MDFFRCWCFCLLKLLFCLVKVIDSKGEKKWIKENWIWIKLMFINYVLKFNIGYINIYVLLKIGILIMIEWDC